MAEYQRSPQRFFLTGIAAMPADALPQGKAPWSVNTRTYEDGTFQPREGLTSRISSALASGIHSISRLNDATPFNGGVSAIRVLGSGANILTGQPAGTTYAVLDTGYSGNPLTTVAAQPPQSVRPYLYVGDTSRQRKFTTDGAAVPIGIPQPSDPSTTPTVAVQGLSTRHVTALGYAAAGTAASTPVTGNRVDTTISQILYDSGTTGYASVVPVSTLNMTVGTALRIDNGGPQETSIITDITIPVTPTTVGSIIYDSGVTGLCTIQPAGSLGTGQLEAPTFLESTRSGQIVAGTRYAVPRGTAGVTPTLEPGSVPTRRIRQVDFPVNALVILNSAETVRILSVAYGQDGTLSFRCRTATTIAAGHTITGVAAIRLHLTMTWAPGATIFDQDAEQTLSFPLLPSGSGGEDIARFTGGIQGALTANLAQFSDGKAVLPDDEVHLAIKVDLLTPVVSVRIYFDVDATTHNFLQNYYFFEWRASDIITAIQSTNAAQVTPLVQARRTVVTNQQLSPIQGYYTPQELAADLANTSGTPADAWALGVARERLVRQRGGSTRSGITSRGRGSQATPAADAATTRQLALGNNQWIDLRCRVKDLVRVGTDPTRSLKDVGAVEVLVSAEAVGKDGDVSISIAPLNAAYGDIWVAGGAGPDVGDVGDPYLYTYRYRSSATGAVSNPAPAQRGGVIPRRQAVQLVPTVSSDPDVDKIDWFRLGSTLTTWSYVGTGGNSTTPYEDRLPDSAIDGIATLEFDNFQPWPTQDLPRTGVCNVAGTAVTRVSGDTFNTSWAPGSALIINGLACTLYASPSSTSFLQVNESLGTGSAVAFTVPGATKMGQPLPSWWGDYQGLWFGCGDPDNPGTLYWTHGNNPEAARDSDTLLVTTPSEPLQGGGIWNTFPFVFSSEQFYQILSTGQTIGGRLRAIQTPCGRGSWTRWSFCLGPEGIFFLGPDGIYVTAGGSPAVSLTDADLRAIFPSDGTPGEEVNGIQPPDMSLATRLRLSYVAGNLYFDYRALNGLDYTLIYDVSAQRWLLDQYVTGMWTRAEEPGAQVFNQILGGLNGELYQYDEDAMTDNGFPINWALWTAMIDAGQPRVTKQFGDLMVSLNANGSVLGISITAVADDWNTVLTPQIIGIGDFGRLSYTIDINSGNGVIARNLGIRIAGSMTDADTARPGMVLWEPSYVMKGDEIARRASDWDTLGYIGAKFVQGVIITANTYGVDKQIMIQRDSAEDMIPLTINHDGEVTIEYPSESQSLPGWDPFIAHQVRMLGEDDQGWQLLNYRFIWEPHPELATQWETQFTSHDLPGYMWVRDVVIAHASDGDIRLRVDYDDGDTNDYTIPASGGTDPLFYKRTYLPLRAGKGIAVRYQLRSGCPFRLFKKDCSVRVSPWGSTQAYIQATPFGGPSRADGASV